MNYVNPNGFGGYYTSLQLNKDHISDILYCNVKNKELKLATCSDETCTTDYATVKSLGSGG